ncbi:MAG: protein kinase domain-containing protein [Akkermansiaceae bacterium]
MSKERYEFRGKIGQGGVGSVYRAFDTQLKREVAIKRVLADGDQEGQEEATKSLLKEASALSSIEHPHIVTIYDVGTDEDGPYVVMELINGKTLDEMVENNPLTWEDLREIILQSEEALAAAQNLNLIHRDLKPSNLMISWLPSGKFQVKIVDFGLAKFSASPSLQTIDHGDSVFGSIFFMAPEQFERTPLDQRTDMYALGCLYYYALTCKHPFDGESAAEVMVSHLQHHVTPIGELRPDIPQWAAEWIMWHIERKMEHRPLNAHEALKRFTAMENQPATAKLAAGPIPTAKFATNTTPVANPGSAPVAPANPTVKIASPTPTVKVAAPAPTIKINAPAEPTASPSPTVKVSAPTSGGTTSSKIKAQPSTLPAAGSQGIDPGVKDSALGMESARKTMSNGAKWALISMLAAVVILTLVLGSAYMEKRKLDNLYNEVMKEAKALDDEKTDGISNLELNGIQISQEEMERILTEATSMQENKQKPLILKTLRFAKAEGGYNIDSMVLNHTINAKCPSSIRAGLLQDVVKFRPHPDNLPLLVEFAKTSAEEDSAAAAVYALASYSGESQVGEYVKDLLNMVKGASSPKVRRAAESTLSRVLADAAPTDKSKYESDLYDFYNKAEDENIKFAMLRLLGPTGGDMATDAISEALNSGTPSLQNAALTAFSQWQTREPIPTLMAFIKDDKNKTLRMEAYETIDTLLRLDREHDSGELQALWRELAATAETEREKGYVIGGLAMQKANWAIELLQPFTKGESDKIIDYAEQAIGKIKRAIRKAEGDTEDSN